MAITTVYLTYPIGNEVLTADLLQRTSYREIGGQKDYAVLGHCVIQCP